MLKFHVHTFQEAIDSKNSLQWKRAMDAEIDSLKENKTWSLVNKPISKQVIDVKWLYKLKNPDIFKARLYSSSWFSAKRTNK